MSGCDLSPAGWAGRYWVQVLPVYEAARRPTGGGRCGPEQGQSCGERRSFDE